MPRLFLRLFLALIAFVFASSFARAQLVLNIDTTEKKVWFTGSDTVNIFALGGSSGWITWGSGGTSFNPLQPTFDPSALSSTVPSTSTNLSVSDTGGDAVFVFVRFSVSSGATTFGGNGPAFALDYSTMPSFAQTLLESKTSLSLDSGTGGSAMSVVHASAIPEPSTYAAFAGMGVLGLAAWRRRRQTATA